LDRGFIQEKREIKCRDSVFDSDDQ